MSLTYLRSMCVSLVKLPISDGITEILFTPRSRDLRDELVNDNLERKHRNYVKVSHGIL